MQKFQLDETHRLEWTIDNFDAFATLNYCEIEQRFGPYDHDVSIWLKLEKEDTKFWFHAYAQPFGAVQWANIRAKIHGVSPQQVG